MDWTFAFAFLGSGWSSWGFFSGCIIWTGGVYDTGGGPREYAFRSVFRHGV